MALHFVADAAGTAHAGGIVELTGAEAHHAAAVRRVRAGEQITITDGRGVWIDGTIESADPASVSVRVSTRTDTEAPNPRLVLVQALAKGDRDEMAVQAATELGVDEVVPWQAARSVSRWEGKKTAKGRERWASIVREAAKQAHRAWLPEVSEPVSTKQLVSRAGTATMLLLDPRSDAQLTATELPDDGEVILVVGPEGGISAEEIGELTGAGARGVRLGETVLRTSTAGPAALAVLNARWGRW
ncbi:MULTISPECIES: 16S rRNA (uracil(1498)-N(3))-methyltransferase [unclassified Microbacterium]|uniref:16S rRNA (uracil(1498)-N(3))-methyltransferase n=1 Tax=unclassified Microbacterium TaxID=2609290 RepID=UPI00097E9172|nr:16S rRNA (uracil(1498)-N(3))-methyltransferase [Microbacterium sp. JB110]RCS62269.1 16S rRNA (uracil(1498)-N(3))-methyltransferase [Microbacterium sp. JB110]SJM44555.1 Ribosomal RNA small subunit methyltransferase E [Frigoribacterium sp. JB110]